MGTMDWLHAIAQVSSSEVTLKDTGTMDWLHANAPVSTSEISLKDMGSMDWLRIIVTANAN